MSLSLDDLRPFVDLLNNPVLLVDAGDNTIILWNQAAVKLFAAGEDELAGADLLGLFDTSPEKLDRFLVSCAGTLDGLPFAVTPKGSEQTHTVYGRRLPTDDDRVIVFLEIAEGSTIRHRFALLSRQMKALEEEVALRRAAENKIRARAEALGRIVFGMRSLTELDTTRPDLLKSMLEIIMRTGDFAGLASAYLKDDAWHIEVGVGSLGPRSGSVMAVEASPKGADALQEAAEGALLAGLGQGVSESGSTGLLHAPVPADDDLQHVLVAHLQAEHVGTGQNLSTLQIFAETCGAMLARVRIEEQLRHAQRLEAIGQLTGGVAHDFNNILAVILGNAELLLDTVQGSDLTLARQVKDAALRGANLTSQLLAFARKQPLDPEVLDLNDVINDLAPMIRRTIGEDVEIAVADTPDIWKVNVDKTQLTSALLNLCINARDAMPDGGRLIIETSNVVIDEDSASRHFDISPGNYALISVSDTGSGMDPETLKNAFEPFYTTKGIGQGSGLGLSMVFGYMKQSGGQVKIYSEVGVGTTVRLYFPKYEDTGRVRGTPAIEAVPDIAKGRKVLVVEDDDQVRTYICRVLESHGYAVQCASDGASAVALDRKNQFDLYLIDVILPGGMNGRQVSEDIRTRKPSAPILFMSGYTENAVVHHGRLDRGVHLISKPFQKVDLLKKLAELGSDIAP